MESIQASDAAVLGELQRIIQKELHGDGVKDRGLHWLIMHGVNTWDAYLQMKGRIEALEFVQAQIVLVSHSLGGGLEEKVIFSRSGMN